MIRPVHLAGTDLQTSCLGFGCASLGSRVSPADGVAALHRAFDGGVRWFDVAPPYGLGEAETLLGLFLRGRRHDVAVLTKVGLAPPRRSTLVKLAYRVGRPALGLARGLRAAVRGSGATRLQKLPLTPELIETSLTASLARLGTDYVDVLALHDPDPAAVVDPAVVRTLEGILASGRARFVAVAGDAEACRAGAAPGLPYRIFQSAIVPGDDPGARLARQAGRPVGFIGHSVFGVAGTHARLLARLSADPLARSRLAAAGYDAADLRTSVGTLLLDAALAANADGVTLVSMFAPRHAAANLARAARAPNPRAVSLVADLVSEAPAQLEGTAA